MTDGGRGMPGGHGHDDWWSADARPPADTDLPAWASRHLDDAAQDAALTPSSPIPAIRRTRRAVPPPGRLRGWGLAVISVATAAAAVPLAMSTLAQKSEPLPHVDTFPVVSPGQLDAGQPESGQPESGQSRVESPGAPGPTDGILTPPETLTGAPVAAPAVVPAGVPASPPAVRPLARTRPASPVRRPAPVVVPAAPAPVVASTPASTTTTTTTGTSTTTTRPEPRSSGTSTSTSTSGSSGSTRSGDTSGDTGSGSGSGSGGSDGGVVGGLVGTVGTTVHGLTG